MSPVPVSAYVGAGSNLGNRQAPLEQAWELLSAQAGIVRRRCSPIYETEPVNMAPGTPWFLNQVWQLEVTVTPEALLILLQDIEIRLGRVRVSETNEGYQSRRLDLDLLLYGAETRYTDTLVVPHPRLHQRGFVVRPLCDLAPELVHPVMGCTMQELLARLEPHLAGLWAWPREAEAE